MKRSIQALLLYILFYAVGYISHYLGWTTYSQHTKDQIAIEIALFTIMFLLYFILCEIEEFKEGNND